MSTNAPAKKRPRTASPSPPPEGGDPLADGLSSSEIIAIVNEIREFTGTAEARAMYFTKKYPFFVERYAILFAASCSPSFDYTRFRYMMSLRDQVTSNKKTLDDASKEVGQVLFDQYVVPIVKDMPPNGQ